MPALPFYIALLPRWCAKPYKDGVNAGIRQTAAALSDIHLIPTDDLGMRLDSIHLDAAGQRALGKRFAEAVEEL